MSDDMTLLESVVRIIKNSNLSAEVQIMPVSIIKNNGDKIPSVGRKYLSFSNQTQDVGNISSITCVENTRLSPNLIAVNSSPLPHPVSRETNSFRMTRPRDDQ